MGDLGDLSCVCDLERDFVVHVAAWSWTALVAAATEVAAAALVIAAAVAATLVVAATAATSPSPVT